MSGGGLKRIGEMALSPVHMFKGAGETIGEGGKSVKDRMTPEIPDAPTPEPPVQQSLSQQTRSADNRRDRRRGLAGTLFAGGTQAGSARRSPLQRKTLLGVGS